MYLTPCLLYTILYTDVLGLSDRGVAPSKLVSCIGVFSPPFNGVSTFCNANSVCASYNHRTEREM